MTKTKKKLSAVFMAMFAVLFVFSIFTTHNTFAAGNIFKIKDVEVAEKDDTVEGDIGAFDDSSIGSYFTFHKVGDKVVYKITLENTDTSSHTIATISDNNNSENLEYSYDRHENTTVAAGDSFDLLLSATYVNGVTDLSQREQTQSLKLSISFVEEAEPDEIEIDQPTSNTDDDTTDGDMIDDDENELPVPNTSDDTTDDPADEDNQDKNETGLVVPNTGDNAVDGKASGVAAGNVALVVISVAGLIVCVVLVVKKHKSAAKYLGVMVAVASTTAVALSVKAATPDTCTITLNTEYGFYDKVVITNGDSQIIADWGTKFEDIAGITAPAVTNYEHSGWNDASGNSIDVTQPVTNDLTVTPVYTRIAFNVTMDANGKSYADGSTSYVLSYDSSDTTHSGNTRTKKLVSHSHNINDKGDMNQTYNDNTVYSDTVTMPEASRIKVTLRYRTEARFDHVYVIKGEYTGTISSNTPTTYVAKLNGGSGDYSTVEYEIDGNTVTFGFYTDSYGIAYYGYYATVEGYDADGNLLYDPEYERELISGTYMETTDENFNGWSENPDAESPDYVSEDEIKKFLEGTNGDNKTLYAVVKKRYSITYDGNGSTAGSMESVHHEDLRLDEPFFGYAANYLRDGYGFVGWSSDKNATPYNGAKIFGPSEAMTPGELRDGNLDENLNIILYAVWVENDETYNLQNFDSAAFEAAHPDQTVIALEDTRDGQSYAVAKLADGNWWMIENLRFDPAGKTLTSENTNNPTTAFANAAQNRTTSTFANCWTETSGAANCYNQYSVDPSNITSTTPNVSEMGGYQWYSYGVYYNWYSATAGNGTYSTAGAVSVDGDICPAGWRLPRSDWKSRATSMTLEDSEFSTLSVALGGNPMFGYDKDQTLVLTQYPNNYIRSGRSMPGNDVGRPVVIGGVRNEIGQYWSGTKGNRGVGGEYGNILTINFYNGRSISMSDNTIDQGFPVRCLKK